VIISFCDFTSQHQDEPLVLHSSVLSAASPRFKARMTGHWGQNSDGHAIDPVNGNKVPLFKYRLVFSDEECFFLTDDVSVFSAPHNYLA
jgi:hypothetical protein